MSFSRSKSDTGRSPTGAATASFKLSASQPALNGSARGTVKLRAAAATLSSARRASLRVGDGAMTTMTTPAPATTPAKPSIEYEFAVSRASASVAEACEHQVKHVKTALALACNSELDVLRKLLKGACSLEAEGLHAKLREQCDDEFKRVSASLSTACAGEVQKVRESCQVEIERLKDALRTACELEVSSVRDRCQLEVEQVKASLQQACSSEVALVREACIAEVQKVKDSLADACQIEVQSMAIQMRSDVERVRKEQRADVEQAAAPYVAAVREAQAATASQLDEMKVALEKEQARATAAEAATARLAAQVVRLQRSAEEGDRHSGVELKLRGGAPFVVLRRPPASSALGALAFLGGGGASGAAAKGTPLAVDRRSVRLSPASDAILLAPEGGERGAAERWPLDELVAVRLGAPAHARRLATRPGSGGGGEAPPWRFLTLQPAAGGARYLLAESDEAAMKWALGLGMRVRALDDERPTVGSLLWRRVRLRLDLSASKQRKADGGGVTRLEACAGLLRSMASEEAARLAWVRHHLQKGEVDAARELGWRPDGGEEGAAPPTPPSRLAVSVD